MKRLILFLALLLPLVCAARQLRPLVWVLDAGHGGKDQGTSLRGVLEKDLTLNLAHRVAALIRKNRPGIKVVLTRSDDSFVSLDDRCQIANKAHADLFLSIHVNFTEHNLLLSGTETFYADRHGAQDIVQASLLDRNAEKSELLAWLLQNSYYNSGRPADRGARKGKLYVLMNTEMPAALTEVGFLSNIVDAAYMCSARGQKQIALDIYKALDAYYTTTKAGTHKTTLRTLRQSYGTKSGLKAGRVLDASESKDLMPMQDPFAASTTPEPPVVEPPTADAPTETPAGTVWEVTSADEREGESTQEFCPELPAETVHPEVLADEANSVSTQNKTEYKPLYSVQLFAVSKKPADGDSRLQGLAPVRTIQVGSVYKVLYGTTPDYKAARVTLEQIKDKFPDAFIVAYVGDRAISTAEALQMSR